MIAQLKEEEKKSEAAAPSSLFVRKEASNDMNVCDACHPCFIFIIILSFVVSFLVVRVFVVLRVNVDQSSFSFSSSFSPWL
jgi:hypothetical protein